MLLLQAVVKTIVNTAIVLIVLKTLFIWDDETKRIVGGYRVGMGADIMKHYGKKGFYTYTLFKMSDKMDPILEETLELGRSFIRLEYQKS